ncbi:uncharacterized protein LOC115975293 isoform X1 [Quercus lobata]|uniref:uncharacterized protein LOC115975293 isoform X1 n=1 Tax=Quercus lobata TaxID=97700 RepID=UPI0012487AD8|nr:uncharacterized protein LOC115975293 isoform X1 [Quercus lobata]
MVKPPKLNKENHVIEMFGDKREDPYYWLRNLSSPEFKSYLGRESRYTQFRYTQFKSYLERENLYSQFMMSDSKFFEDDLYKEMKGKMNIEDDGDEIVGERRRPKYYHQRWSPMGKNAAGFNMGSSFELYYKPEADANDFEGNEIFTISIFDRTEHTVETLEGVTDSFEWVNEEALVYIALEKKTLRPYKAYLHILGTEQASDTPLYEEEDDKFSLNVRASESKKFLFVTSVSKTTSFNFYLDVSKHDVSKHEYRLEVLTPREDGIDTYVSHRGNHFFIVRRTDEYFNSEVVACLLDKTAETIVLPHRERIKIQDIELFKDHLVVYERVNGLPIVTIYGLPNVEEPVMRLQHCVHVQFDDPTYFVERLGSEFNSSFLQLRYSTLKTPPLEYEVDMKTGNKVKKNEKVLENFDASNYVIERKWANAQDGTEIPISIVYHQDLVKLDGSAPLLLTGYGSYETCTEPHFEESRLSLLDRGFIYAIAHIRGGGEMGRKWYENGKLLKKENTFTDFIHCAEYLTENKYCSKEKLSIIGGSAGGLLIGVVLNMRPDLFKVAVAEVPFVDVLTTMLDPTIPMTTLEWEEWGDPREEGFYKYMKSYSPVDNVKATNYPNILVTTGFNDTRVLCSEPTKFVAKLRDRKTDDNLLLFKCDFHAGHLPKSRDAKLQGDAFKYAFIMKSLNMIPNPGSDQN